MFTKEEQEIVRLWYCDFKQQSSSRNTRPAKTKRQEWYVNNQFPAKEKLIKLYDSGIGLKRLAKSLSISYTDIRTLMIKYIKTDIRHGRNVVTDELRRIRSEIQINNKDNNFRNWPSKRPDMTALNSGNVQGYYLRENGEYVWLRSTLEYIYAKWLDKNSISWEHEPDCFKLQNGETYRPDFRIKTESGYKYIEIKGRYHTDNKAHKPLMLSELGVKTELIKDLDEFQEHSYAKELKEWKSVRLSKEELQKKQSSQTKMSMISQ